MMPTNEDNARAIAARKGYEITRMRLMPDNVYAYVAVDPVTQRVHARADDWPTMLRHLLQAQPLGDSVGRVSRSVTEITDEIERRDDDPRPAA